LKKSTVRDFFRPILTLWDPKCAYWNLSKNGPHKKHCAWGPPPPLARGQIYRNLLIFTENRAFNAAGKTVTKIGIYALPPPKSGPKSEILAIFPIFPIFSIFLIIRDPFHLNLISHHRQTLN
jgi:hypothetical protein